MRIGACRQLGLLFPDEIVARRQASPRLFLLWAEPHPWRWEVKEDHAQLSCRVDQQHSSDIIENGALALVTKLYSAVCRGPTGTITWAYGVPFHIT